MRCLAKLLPIRAILAGVTFTAVLSGCGGSSGGASTPESSSKARNLSPVVAQATEASLSRSVAALGLDLVGSSSENLVVAPFSASSALAKLRAGAGGSTLDALDGVLHYGGGNADLYAAYNSLDLKIASRVSSTGLNGQPSYLSSAAWLQQRYVYRIGYLDLLAENFGLLPARVDFSLSPVDAWRAIGAWLLQQSGDLAGDSLASTDTRLDVAESSQFNLPWVDPFDSALTQISGFELLNGVVTPDVPFLTKTMVVPTALEDGYLAVGIPLRGDQQFLVVLPDSGRFDEIRNSLTPERIEQIAASLTPLSVNLLIPKFQIRYSTNLDLGAAAARGTADFSGIDGTGELFVFAATHRAKVTVTEAGIQAGSVTDLTLDDHIPQTWNSAGFYNSAVTIMDQFPITLGRPLIFMVRDTATGTVLLMGQLTDPQP